METTNIFSPGRLLYLFKRDLYSNINTTIITSGAAMAVIYLISAISAYYGSPSDQLYYNLFTKLLFIGGLIATSTIFREMHRKETAQNYLLLPASTFEKFFSRLFISTIGFAVITIVGLTIISYLSEGINILIINRHNQIFNPFTKEVWIMTAHYFVIQSIFFLGAVYFRKHNFIKTINFIFLFTISISLLGIFFTKIIYFDIFNDFFRPDDAGFLFQWNSLSINPKDINTITTIARTLYWLIPAPLFWTIAYFRLKEAEVKNAI